MSMSKFASKDDYYVSKIQERDKAIAELQAKYDALESSNTEYRRLYRVIADEYYKQKRQLTELRKAMTREIEGYRDDGWFAATEMEALLKEQADE